jgi:hypothetical protein
LFFWGRPAAGLKNLTWPLEVVEALLHKRAPIEGLVGLVEGHYERVALREDLVPLQGWMAVRESAHSQCTGKPQLNVLHRLLLKLEHVKARITWVCGLMWRGSGGRAIPKAFLQGKGMCRASLVQQACCQDVHPTWPWSSERRAHRLVSAGCRLFLADRVETYMMTGIMGLSGGSLRWLDKGRALLPGEKRIDAKISTRPCEAYLDVCYNHRHGAACPKHARRCAPQRHIPVRDGVPPPTV